MCFMPIHLHKTIFNPTSKKQFYLKKPGINTTYPSPKRSRYRRSKSMRIRIRNTEINLSQYSFSMYGRKKSLRLGEKAQKKMNENGIFS